MNRAFTAGPECPDGVKIATHGNLENGLAPKTGSTRGNRAQEGGFSGGSGRFEAVSYMIRRGRFAGQIPCQLDAASGEALRFVFSTRCERIGTLKAALPYLLPQRVALLADPDGVLAQLRAEGLFDEQDRLEGRNVYIIIYTPEPPADALAGHVERLVNLLAVRTTEHHVARAVRFQLDPQVLRLDQALQILQEFLVLLR